MKEYDNGGVVQQVKRQARENEHWIGCGGRGYFSLSSTLSIEQSNWFLEPLGCLAIFGK
jgi:hypothetical protein